MNITMNENVKAEWTELLLRDLFLEGHSSISRLENLNSDCKKLEKWVPIYRTLILARGNAHGYTFDRFYQELDEMVKKGDMDMLKFRSDLERYVHDPRNNLHEVAMVMRFVIRDTMTT